MRVIMAGGGTGGHIYPGLTIARELQRQVPGTEVIFVGTSRGMEVQLVPREGFELQTMPLRSLKRSLSLDNFRAAGDAAAGVFRAGGIIGKFRPDAVIGTGGYVSGPVVLAGRLRGCATFLQEQNALPGLTTRWLAPWVDQVFVGYQEAIPRLSSRTKTLYTGNPVRPEILAVDRAEGLQAYGLRPDRKTLLIFGASQGARSINQTFLSIVEELHRLPWLQVVHQTGQKGFQEVAGPLKKLGAVEEGDHLRWDQIQVYPYLFRMGEILAASDLVVGRAGAVSIAEITVLGKPCLLIPLPTAAENHQEFNARVLEERGAAIMIKERDLTGRNLMGIIVRILGSEKDLKAMGTASSGLGRKNAAAEIAARVREVVEVRKRARRK